MAISIQRKAYDVADWVKDLGGDTPLLNLATNNTINAFIASHPCTVGKSLDKFFTGNKHHDSKKLVGLRFRFKGVKDFDGQENEISG